MISIIAAVSEDLIIGLNGRMPWDIPEETSSFKKLTFGKTVIMGRKTFAETGILPGRRNLVLSKNLPKAEGIEVYRNLDDALDAAKNGKETFIIGGGSLFSQTISIAEKMYISHIVGSYAGDVFFPNFDTGEWVMGDPEVHKDFTLIIYTRKKK